MSLLAATALSGGVVAAIPVKAQTRYGWNAMPVTGLYIGLGVGPNWVNETSLNQSGNITAALRNAGFAAPAGMRASTPASPPSAVWAGALATARARGRVRLRWIDFDKFTGFGLLAALGRLNNQNAQPETFGLMLNLLYDFEIPGSPWVVPYVATGIGMAWTRWSTNRSFNVPPNLSVKVDGDTQFNFACQASSARPSRSSPSPA